MSGTNAWGVGSDGDKKSSLATLAEKLETPQVVSRINTVRVDGMVLLKIIKHCTESLPDICSGTLLGLDMDSALEVTNCVASPNEIVDPEEMKQYHLGMLRLLRDTNSDANPVGIYQSTDLSYDGSFATTRVIDVLFKHQEELDQEYCQKFTALVYDPLETKKGRLSIKAYRLSDTFMNFYRGKDTTVTWRNGVVQLSNNVINEAGGLRGDGSAEPASAPVEIGADAIFEEITVEIVNAHLSTVLVEDLREQYGDRTNVDFDRFNLSCNPYLESKLQVLQSLVEKLSSESKQLRDEQRKLQKYEADQIQWIQARRALNRARAERGEAPLPEDADASLAIFKPFPRSSKLESMLIRKQIHLYCDQVNKFVGSGFSKLYMAGGLQKDSQP